MEVKINRSESLKNISAALIEFQEKVGPIFRDQTASIATKNGGKMQYKFADLAAIQDVISVPLIECGLVVIQSPVGEYSLETLIIHAESDEFISSIYKMVPAGNTPQSQGSTITYQKRYALTAMLNLQILDDDDAKKGSSRTTEEAQANKAFLKASKQLQEDSRKENFYSKLYQAERALLKSRGEFSLREFLAQHYEFTSAVIASIEDNYFEYKVKNSLP